MIGQTSYKLDMRVLRVHVTWFLYFFPQKIPTQDLCDMCDMHDIRIYGTGEMKVWTHVTHVTHVTCVT